MEGASSAIAVDDSASGGVGGGVNALTRLLLVVQPPGAAVCVRVSV